MNGPLQTKAHSHGAQGSVDGGPPCGSDSAIQPVTSATGSRWRHRVGGSPKDRKYPEREGWKGVVKLFRECAETYTSAQLLMELSLGKVSKSPFTPASISELKNEVIKLAQSYGLEQHRAESDRNNVPMDFRFMDLC